MTLPESALPKTVSSLENTTLPSFSRILLVTNQSGTNLNVGRKTTALLHNSWVIYLIWKYFSIKGSLETTLSHHTFFESRIDQEQNQL